MASDSIERQILIQAPVEVVWGVITEPQQIVKWFADEAELDARAGADGRLAWRPGGRAGDIASETLAPIRVVDAEPFRRFSFRWNHPAGSAPDASNSALVEFTLSEDDRGTLLTVVESGITLVTNDGEERTRYFESHERGWGKHLGELRDHVAASAPETAR